MRRRLLQAGALLVIAGVAVLMVLGAVRPTQLRTVSPGDGATLTAAPDEVALTFDGTPALAEFHLSVTGPDGRLVSQGDPRLTDRRLAVPARIAGDGTYQIAYHVLFTDGREVTGSAGYTVAAAGPAAPGNPAIAVAATQSDHDHTGGGDPFNAFLAVLGVVLALTIVALLLWRPRPERRQALRDALVGGRPPT
ncbi:copper resistance CopC family protein [Dactylosporangium sp. CS-033363]|uniref:copper resistance CopC family protein n=1 Tax=Dactylosporangium sp. CS-033363 TaxID=3239935 RepID=UPI003D950401